MYMAFIMIEIISLVTTGIINAETALKITKELEKNNIPTENEYSFKTEDIKDFDFKILLPLLNIFFAIKEKNETLHAKDLLIETAKEGYILKGKDIPKIENKTEDEIYETKIIEKDYGTIEYKINKENGIIDVLNVDGVFKDLSYNTLVKFINDETNTVHFVPLDEKPKEKTLGTYPKKNY